MSDVVTTMPRIGDLAPDFKAITTQGEIQFHDYKKGQWCVFFSHPADFTPVCTTELAEFARRSAEFEKRHTRLLCLSVDSIHAHIAWRENIRQRLDVVLNYPLVADVSMEVARKYGMIHPGASATATVRAVFFIDPKNTVRALVYYPMNAGRNIDEVLRIVDALQTADTHSVACPVNWRPGDKVIVPPPKTEKEVEERARSNYEVIDFYLAKKQV
ncbi:MAG: peroxiredoxin [Planctomycetes bacterium]|nr:peroxiredoxin [Planctomycetota bacterium]